MSKSFEYGGRGSTWVKGSKALYFGKHGKSHWLVTCECLQTLKIYAWRGCKRCPNCKKVVYI